MPRRSQKTTPRCRSQFLLIPSNACAGKGPKTAKLRDGIMGGAWPGAHSSAFVSLALRFAFSRVSRTLNYSTLAATMVSVLGLWRLGSKAALEVGE